ncbi:Mycobacterium rhizamassiliense ORFan [Mycobacterium rhizamassiliense]|jgi:hypothetical protein|uniref:Mycobacterium rhizamassiliense ORFan n=1 Tax=Mycobacterium rhizamassiliense TaxID=1841860 RepID=A0A2U3NQZ4_9MYCO|nr:hypothetical protein [Mycobacterium rhizamassiliense]SPM33939.1 Mycobacterium rhizamassiliense ORFan [Mycobacterium rhizamassiliense]
MRRLGIIMAVVAALLGCTPRPKAAATPVAAVFGRHAAIYRLVRDDPNFVAWLAILQQSRNDGTPVRFSYDVVGPRLTMVEPAQ